MKPEPVVKRFKRCAHRVLAKAPLLRSQGFNGFLLLTLLPGLITLLVTAMSAYDRERTAAHQSLLARVRNISQLLDEQFIRIEGNLEVLAATSDELERRDLASFYEKLVQAKTKLPGTVALSLSEPSGQMLLSTLRPYGTALPVSASAWRLKKVLETGLPQVSPVIKGKLMGQYQMTVDVPVIRNGRIVYVLSASLPCKDLNDLLFKQIFPEGWISVVYDRSGTIAARTLNQDANVGRKVAPALRQWLDGPPEYIGEGKTLEGRTSIATMHRSALTGYSVAASVPESTLSRPLLVAQIINIAAVGGGLLLGAFIAWRFVRSMRRSIRMLERATDAVACGADGIDLPDSKSRELNRLFDRFKQMFSALKASQTATAQYQRKLEFLATHDPLTGLANRLLIQTRIEQAVLLAQRSTRMTAVLLLDLDNFKGVNDMLAHSAGDALLVEITRRLNARVRPVDTVARLGGDEFLIMLTDIGSTAEVEAVAAKLLDAVSQPTLISEREICITASIGITLAPVDGVKTDDLIRNADIAMYEVKENGKANYKFFSGDMKARIQERGKIEAELRHAIRRQEFVLYYQPRCDLATGNIVGAEALIRWNHPERGLVSPAGFIQVAEQTGMIVPIGEWVLESACRSARDWERLGYTDVTVSINVSARQFQSKDFPERVAHYLKATGLRPELLELELTESDAMRDPEAALRMLHEIKALGVKISLDDFGTGYSSLSYLKRFPIDCLKIDRSFIRDITVDPEDAAIAQTVIALGSTLKRTVVAEGVETEAQLELLRTLKCEQVQGYLFSPPVPVAQFEAQLAAERHQPA